MSTYQNTWNTDKHSIENTYETHNWRIKRLERGESLFHAVSLRSALHFDNICIPFVIVVSEYIYSQI
jgi:hypothetical protein